MGDLDRRSDSSPRPTLCIKGIQRVNQQMRLYSVFLSASQINKNFKINDSLSHAIIFANALLVLPIEALLYYCPILQVNKGKNLTF